MSNLRNPIYRIDVDSDLTEQHDGFDSISFSIPSQNLVRDLHKPLLINSSSELISDYFTPDTEEKKTCIQPSTVAKGYAILADTASDTFRFMLGLNNTNEPVLGMIPGSSVTTDVIVAFYCAQKAAVNYRFGNAGIDKMQRLIKPAPNSTEFESLPLNTNLKVVGTTLLMSGYAIFADCMAAAYFLTSQGYGLPTAINFLLGALMGIGKIPTEHFSFYLKMRESFSKTITPTENAFNILRNTEDYLKHDKLYRAAFDTTWLEFSFYLKATLLKPENESYLEANEETLANKLGLPTSDGKKLADNLRLLTFETDPDIIFTTLLSLKLEVNIAKEFARKFADVNIYRRLADIPHQETLWSQLFESLIYFTKKLLIFFIGAKETIESYVSVAAMLGVSDPRLKFFLLFMSIANGVIDVCFAGKNNSDAIDKFRAALTQHTIQAKDVIAFTLALFSAGLVAHANLNTLLYMIDVEPSATLPYPLPAKLPDIAAYIVSYGVTALASINFTYYLQPVFQGLIDNVYSRYTRVANRDEYLKLQATKEVIIKILSETDEKFEEIETDEDYINISPLQTEQPDDEDFIIIDKHGAKATKTNSDANTSDDLREEDVLDISNLKTLTTQEPASASSVTSSTDTSLSSHDTPPSEFTPSSPSPTASPSHFANSTLPLFSPRRNSFSSAPPNSPSSPNLTK